MVLYDVSSSYFEGRTCPLAKLGYSRDGKLGLPQIIYGLLCDMAGRPVAVEVFSGELHDDATLPAQVTKLKDRFGLSRVVVVADRGMVTKANIELLGQAGGVDWITALKAPTIKKLARSGVFQPSLFDEQNLGEITDPGEFPGERLIVCRNPLVGAQRARKREELLAATESRPRARSRTRGPRDAARRRPDRAGGRTGAEALPDAKALPDRDHRHHLHLHPRHRRDRRGSGAGRVLHPAHQPHRDRPPGRRCRARLQEPRTGRKSVRVTERPRAADPPDPSPPRGPRPRARPDLHARLLPHLAPESRVETAAVHRRGPARQPRPGRQSRPLPRRATQSADETDQHRRSPRTATARSSPSSRPRPGTPPASRATPAPSRSSPSRPRSKPRRSISPSTPPSWPFGRHDPNTPNPPKTQGTSRIRLPHQGELRTSAAPPLCSSSIKAAVHTHRGGRGVAFGGGPPLSYPRGAGRWPDRGSSRGRSEPDERVEPGDSWVKQRDGASV